MCNNSLFEVCCAKNVPGLSKIPKTRIFRLRSESGRRAFPTAVKADPRGLLERWEERMLAQVIEKADAKSAPRKSKVSVAMAIIHGLGDPKAMVKTAADG